MPVGIQETPLYYTLKDGDSGGNRRRRSRPAYRALNFPCGKGVKLL